MQIIHPMCTNISSKTMELLLQVQHVKLSNLDPNLLERRDKIERTEMNIHAENHRKHYCNKTQRDI